MEEIKNKYLNVSSALELANPSVTDLRKPITNYRYE